MMTVSPTCTLRLPYQERFTHQANILPDLYLNPLQTAEDFEAVTLGDLPPDIEVYAGNTALQHALALEHAQEWFSQTMELRTNMEARILTARERLSGFVKDVQPEYSEGLSRSLGANVYLQREDLQPVGSFKVRGAANKVLALSPEERARGLAAASAGNHAQGVSYIARHLGLRAKIFMPEGTPQYKVDAVHALGATAILLGTTFDETSAFAQKMAKEEGLTYIPPFDDVDVIAGQGTIGLAIGEKYPKATHVFAPYGGGGLVSGLVSGVRLNAPEAEVYGVEHHGSQAFNAALRNSGPTKITLTDRSAEGCAVATVGSLTFEHSATQVDGALGVSTKELEHAGSVIEAELGFRPELSALLGVAGLLKYAQSGRLLGAEAVAVITAREARTTA